MAASTGMTPDGVKYHLDSLRKSGRIRHVGSRKKGRWEVMEDYIDSADIRTGGMRNAVVEDDGAEGNAVKVVRKTAQETTQETAQETAQETTQEKILDLLRRHPGLTRERLAASIGMTPDGVKYHLDNLRKSGRIRHVGPRKKGRWEVMDDG